MKHDNDLELTVLSEDSSEWDLMWNALGKHRINRALSEPTIAENFGEVWQYMETHKVRCWFGLREKYFHFFRHRFHPKKGCLYIPIPASRKFKPADLIVTWSMKSWSSYGR